MIIRNFNEIKKEDLDIVKYDCIVIIAKYNFGKSSVCTDKIHDFFGKDNVCYVTFTDQSKPNFKPRRSKLEFDEIIKDKIIIFDEINDDNGRDLNDYLERLIENNKVIILTNPYGLSDDPKKEISLFLDGEKNILPEKTMFIFVQEKI